MGKLQCACGCVYETATAEKEMSADLVQCPMCVEVETEEEVEEQTGEEAIEAKMDELAGEDAEEDTEISQPTPKVRNPRNTNGKHYNFKYTEEVIEFLKEERKNPRPGARTGDELIAQLDQDEGH